ERSDEAIQESVAPAPGLLRCARNDESLTRRRWRKLRLDQFGKESALADQLVERAGLDDASLAKHQNARGVADGAEPVRDHEGGAALHHLVERHVEAGFGQRIERAGRFVEDEDRRVLEQRAGDGEALALAAGQQPAALADAGLEALRVAV